MVDRASSLSERMHTPAATTSPPQIQYASPILRLPAELRNNVYNHVFRVRTIPLYCPPYAAHAPGKPFWSTMGFQKHQVHVHYPRGNLALLGTCRQIYSEAKLLPFTLNTFIGFPRTFSALTFVIGKTQLCAIESIKMLIGSDDMDIEPTTRSLRCASYMYQLVSPARYLPALRRFEVAWVGVWIDEDEWPIAKRRLLDRLEELWWQWIGVTIEVVQVQTSCDLAEWQSWIE
jgi:hypothetical protein